MVSQWKTSFCGIKQHLPPEGINKREKISKISESSCRLCLWNSLCFHFLPFTRPHFEVWQPQDWSFGLCWYCTAVSDTQLLPAPFCSSNSSGWLKLSALWPCWYKKLFYWLCKAQGQLQRGNHPSLFQSHPKQHHHRDNKENINNNNNKWHVYVIQHLQLPTTSKRVSPLLEAPAEERLEQKGINPPKVEPEGAFLLNFSLTDRGRRSEPGTCQALHVQRTEQNQRTEHPEPSIPSTKKGGNSL